MAIYHRTAHLPLARARFGSGQKIIPDCASATYNKEANDVDQVITSWTILTVTSAEKFAAPTISFKAYGTADYWWFILWYNGIINPTRELFAGLKIKIPDYNQMVAYLSTSTRKSVPDFVRI